MNRSVLSTFLALSILCFAFVANVSTGQTIGNPESQKALAQWSSLTPMPDAKYNHASAYLNGVIYVFGGSNATGASNETYKYNVSSDSWTTGAILPEARIFATAEAVNGKIYLLGGYLKLSPFTLTPNVLEYDPASNSFSVRAAMPTPVAACASFVVDNKIYVVGGSASGGFNTDYKNTVQVYDPAANQWTSATALPYAARNVAAASVGNTVIVVGGYGSSPTFKPTTHKGTVTGTSIVWSKLADYPVGGINRAAAGATADKVYITGGQTSDSKPSVKTYAYNLTSDSWEAQADKITAVHSLSKFIFDGSGWMFALGGYGASAATKVNEAMVTVTAPKILVNRQDISVVLQVGSSRRFDLEISNKGSAQLTWTATVEPPTATWLTIAPGNGSIAIENSQNVNATINTAGLAVGDYNATLKIQSNDPDPSRTVINLPVTLKVQKELADVPRKILLEEFTGTWCPWCPYGVDSIDAILQRDPDGVNVISYHNGDPMSTPLESAFENFLQTPFYPSGFVNRLKFWNNSTVDNGRFYWSQFIDSLFKVETRSPIDISITNKVYNTATKQMALRVNVKFLSPVSGPLRMNVAQTESGQNWAQQKANWTPPEIYPYYHKHVLKLTLPDVKGELITDSAPMQAGSVFTKDYSFVSKDSIADKCEFVVYVHRSNGNTAGEVLQSHEEEMMFQTTITDVAPEGQLLDFSLAQNFPNPFNPSTTISYGIPSSGYVTLKIYNALGKEIATLVSENKHAGIHTAVWNALNQSSGLYFYKLELNGNSLTRKMTLLK